MHVSKIRTDGMDIASIEFSADHFKDEKAVKGWLDNGGYTDYKVVKTDDGFKVENGDLEFDGKAQKIENGKGVTMWVGKVAVAAKTEDEPAAAEQPHGEVTSAKDDGLEEDEDGVLTEKASDGSATGSDADNGYADPGYQKDGKKRYPLKKNGKWSEERIRAAWNYIHKAKNRAKYSDDQVTKIENKIIAAWKKAIDPKGPPEASAGSQKEDGTMQRVARKADVEEMKRRGDALVAELSKKSIMAVQDMLNVYGWMGYCLDEVQYEAAIEGDGSALPGMIKNALSQWGAIIQAAISEEVSEGDIDADPALAQASDEARNGSQKEGAMATEAAKTEQTETQTTDEAAGKSTVAEGNQPTDKGAQGAAKTDGDASAQPGPRAESGEGEAAQKTEQTEQAAPTLEQKVDALTEMFTKLLAEKTAKADEASEAGASERQTRKGADVDEAGQQSVKAEPTEHQKAVRKMRVEAFLGKPFTRR